MCFSDKSKLISVVIPVKNGKPWLDKCIQGIMEQSLFEKTEIVVVDSGSTDGSIELLKKYPVNVFTISPEEFNHGLTRNYGVQQCKGEYIVLTVQDACPTDDRWLEKLLEGFNRAKNVAAVCGQQIVPHDPDKNPLEWFRPVGEAEVRVVSYKSPKEYDDLSPAEKKRDSSWDNVTAMYRLDVLRKIPFPKISFGEDVAWAREALTNGYSIVYNPNARVYHYHLEDEEFAFKRAMATMYLRYKSFGYLHSQPRMRFVDFLRMIRTIWRAESINIKEKYNWIRYNIHHFRATQKAHHVFADALSKGEEVLDRVYDQYCNKPPMHTKRSAR